MSKHRSEIAEPSPYSLAILGGMQGRKIFAGLDANHPTKSTVKRASTRRAAAKRARVARRVNR